jgi:putative nucleotidyltransferase with HDIG domain
MSDKTATKASYLADVDMAKIPKNFVIDGLILPVQIYVRLSTNTYLTIAKKGEKAQLENFKSFKNDNFHLYVKVEDKSYLTGFIEDLSRRAMDNPKVGLDKKAHFVTGLLSEAYGDLETSKFSNVERLRSVGNLVIKICKQATQLQDIIDILKNQRADDAKHGMMTAMVSVMMADEAKMLSPLNQDKLVTGALLHDVGLRVLPPEIRTKARHLWTDEEAKTYRQHPIQGAELLRYVEGMSVEVLLIIAEHHELGNGTGYPKGLREARINQLAKIVGLAATFCDLISNSEGKQHSAPESIEYIENVLGQPYNKGLFSALKNMVNRQMLVDKLTKAS